MTARRLYPTLAAVLALAGCNLAPRYAAPAMPVPAAFPAAGAGGAAAVSAQDLDWRDFYADVQLRKVIERALAGNRDLRVSVLQTERARAYYRIQRAALLPQVDAVGTASKQRLPASVSGTGQVQFPEQYGVSAGVSAWEIDFFGRIRNLKDQALDQFLATGQAQRAGRLSLRAEVANAYLTLAGDRETLKLAQDTLESQTSTYKMVQKRFELGASSAIDARRAQISMESARVDVASYTRVVALDRSTLDLLVGSSVPADLLPENLSSLEPLRDDFTIGVASDVLARRPDILMAENQLKAANANIGAARAAFFPTISLTTSFGTLDSRLSGLFKSGSEAWTFAPQITVPIFDYGARRANLKVSKVDREICLAQYEKAIQVAFKEVNDALVQRGSLREQAQAQESLVQAADAAYRLTRARYDAGMEGSLGMLDAQRSSYASQQGLIALRRAQYNNLVTLYKVLGGGANPASEPGKKQ